MTTDSVLREAIGAVFRNFWRLTVVIVGAFVPAVLGFGWAIALAAWQSEQPEPEDLYVLGLLLAAVVLGALAYLAAQAASQVITVDYLSNRKPRLGRSVRVGLRHMPSILGAAVLGGLAYVLGLALLVVPGIVVLTAIALTFPAIIFEDLGPVAGLKRSWELSKGYRLSIFLSFTAIYVLTSLAAIPAQVFFLGTAGAEEGGPVNWVSFTLGSAVMGMVYLISTAFYCVLPGVFYLRIKEAREGLDVRALAAVFE